MRVKNVVKVMNFHALLRVDASKRNAEKYLIMQEVLQRMIDSIMNNRNFILDKKIVIPDESKPELNIYIGSDLGFCGNYNSQINRVVFREDDESDKIIIGKKIHIGSGKVLLRIRKDQCMARSDELARILENSIMNRQHSKINIIYNHYKNMGSINLVKRTIYPMQLQEKDSVDYSDDFVVETDVRELLGKLIACYVNYEMRICLVNSNASENVMRQNVTKESMVKIDEREEILGMKMRKQKRAKEFRKIIESYTQQAARD